MGKYYTISKNTKNLTKLHYFHQIGPLGRFGLVVATSVSCWIYISPSHEIFFRPLIALCEKPFQKLNLQFVSP